MISMAKITKAQAKRLMKDAHAKVRKVYMAGGIARFGAVKTADMDAVDKIVARVLKRLG